MAKQLLSHHLNQFWLAVNTIESLWPNATEVWVKIRRFSIKKMFCKMSAKCWPLRSGLNMSSSWEWANESLLQRSATLLVRGIHQSLVDFPHRGASNAETVSFSWHHLATDNPKITSYIGGLRAQIVLLRQNFLMGKCRRLPRGQLKHRNRWI